MMISVVMRSKEKKAAVFLLPLLLFLGIAACSTSSWNSNGSIRLCHHDKRLNLVKVPQEHKRKQ
jgi:hypothetical protein